MVLARLCVYRALRIDTVTGPHAAVGKATEIMPWYVRAKSFDSEAGTCLCLDSRDESQPRPDVFNQHDIADSKMRDAPQVEWQAHVFCDSP